MQQTTETQRFRSLAVYARLIGGRYGVDVVMDANAPTASNNGKRIVVPSLDIGDEADAILIEGYIDHEAGGHSLHTNFKGAQEWFQAHPQYATPLIKSLANVFEDVWIERELTKKKPGCAKTIADTVRILIERVQLRPVDDNTPIPGLLIMGLLYRLRSTLRGQQQLGPWGIDAWQRLSKQWGEEFADRIWEIAQQVHDCKDTLTAIRMAVTISEALKDEAKKRAQKKEQKQSAQSQAQSQNGAAKPDSDTPSDTKPQQGERQGDDDGDGQGGKSGEKNSNQEAGEHGGKDGDQQADEPSDQADSAKSNQLAGDRGDQQGEKQGDQQAPSGDANPAGLAASSDDDEAAESALNRVLSASLEDIGSGELADAIRAGLKASKAPEQAAKAGIHLGAGGNFSHRPATLIRQARPDVSQISRPIVNTLGSKLEDALQAEVDKQTYRAKSGRRIDRDLLSQVIAAKRSDIFVRRDETHEIDTAITILTDVSASMENTFESQVSRIDAAQATTLALGDVLERFEVPFSVVCFGASVTPLKTFDQSWRARKEFAPVRLEPDTVTHKAIELALPALACRNESRKLLVVITDGVPSSSPATALMLQEAARLGVEPSVVVVSSHRDSNLEEFERALASHQIASAKASDTASLAKAVFNAVNPALI
jgi:cobaltochelatase CobT